MLHLSVMLLRQLDHEQLVPSTVRVCVTLQCSPSSLVEFSDSTAEKTSTAWVMMHPNGSFPSGWARVKPSMQSQFKHCAVAPPK
jgi:hypothetical protein